MSFKLILKFLQLLQYNRHKRSKVKRSYYDIYRLGIELVKKNQKNQRKKKKIKIPNKQARIRGSISPNYSKNPKKKTKYSENYNAIGHDIALDSKYYETSNYSKQQLNNDDNIKLNNDDKQQHIIPQQQLNNDVNLNKPSDLQPFPEVFKFIAPGISIFLPLRIV